MPTTGIRSQNPIAQVTEHNTRRRRRGNCQRLNDTIPFCLMWYRFAQTKFNVPCDNLDVVLLPNQKKKAVFL
jgi:hypothetical protein